jgi:hemerythrin superfamily protein
MSRKRTFPSIDALTLLESQHRELETLFSSLRAAESAGVRTTLFEQLEDQLAIHAALEERHFYPAVKGERTEARVLESIEDHRTIERSLATLLQLGRTGRPGFDARLEVLEAQVAHHVREDEVDLFPKVRQLLDSKRLVTLGQEMRDEQAALLSRGGAPRRREKDAEAGGPL